MKDDVLNYLENLIENCRTETDYNSYCRLVEIKDLIQKQQTKIKEQIELIKKQHSIITSCEMEHNYDVKMIDKLKGECVKYNKIINDMAESLTFLYEEPKEKIIKIFTKRY